MGFIAELHVSPPDSLLAATVRSNPDTTVRWEHTVPADGAPRLYVSAFGDDFDRFEAALGDDPTVADVRRVATFANRCVYVVRPEGDRTLIPSVCAELGLFVFSAVAVEDGWAFKLQVPDREALVDFREHCLTRDVGFRVDRLQQPDYSEEVSTVGLTARERELLLTAFYAGYFDVPRRTSQSDLADRLDVSTSAVSQGLRRAVEKLIATTIDADSSAP